MESQPPTEGETQTRVRQQEVVADLGQQALETDDLDQLMHDAAEAVAETLDNEYAKVLELLPAADEVFLRQGVGWRDGLVGDATVPTDLDSQAGYTLISEEPVIVDDLRTEERFSGPELLTSHDVISGISVIIGSVEEPWGVLGTHDTERREFTEYDATFVQSVANVLASAIERSERERRLEATNERLGRYREYTDDILDAIDDVFYVLDADGTLQRWNESVCEVTGYSDAEVAEMRAVEFFDEDDRETIAEAVAEGFENGSVEVEAEFFTKGGAYVPYEFVASALEDPDSNPVLAGVGRNVAERNERERELEQRARQQQVVADLGQIALETANLDELMHEAASQVAAVLDNDYCKVLDLDPERRELLLRQGVGWQEGIVGSATVAADDNSQAGFTLLSEEPVVVDDLEMETRFSGPELLTSHDVTSGISTIIGSVDDPWGILGTHDTERREFTDEDVTFVKSVANVLAEAIERHRYQAELEELIDKLEESNERLEQFAYAASHDLQEPLRMVSSYLQLLERRYADTLDEDGEEFIEFAVDGADRMRDMIEGLLQYSRVDTRGDPFEPVDLDAVLADVRQDLQVKLEEHDAEITAEDLPEVYGDGSQLTQVFQNLLDNAIEYSGDDPPRIHASAERADHGDEWVISVSDEGVGIDPGEQERVFEVFQSLQGHDEAGTGIGLALCERIVERHGGDVWVDSEPGEGATFSFTLPAAGERDE